MTPERLLGRRASYRIARYFIPSGQHLNDGNADAECGALKQCAAQAFVTGSRLCYGNPGPGLTLGGAARLPDPAAFNIPHPNQAAIWCSRSEEHTSELQSLRH